MNRCIPPLQTRLAMPRRGKRESRRSTLMCHHHHFHPRLMAPSSWRSAVQVKDALEVPLCLLCARIKEATPLPPPEGHYSVFLETPLLSRGNQSAASLSAAVYRRSRPKKRGGEKKVSKENTIIAAFLSSSVTIFILFPFAARPAQHRWRSSGDLNQMYHAATPNPTGSLSGPWFDPEGSGNVTGVAGKSAYMVCRVKNLGKHQTVRC